MSSNWPENVGILSIEFYFPSQYVDQTELEKYDNVSEGKYTKGLGQSKMGFCTDLEDINSICLTVLNNLMEKNNIDYNLIGRLEVGTETLVDKSKSVKTVLMKLFEDSGNFNVEGVDTTNACYGGTNALFNAISWVESSYWDGRYAIVVTGDIAVYEEGNARPTGGAGAIAMLIGPNAPLVFDRGLRTSYIKHAYDFYKPNLNSEYPVVDGKLSIQCYLKALDNCYNNYKKLYKQKYINKNIGFINKNNINEQQELNGKLNEIDEEYNEDINLNHFNAILFHSPYCKLVQKSFARLSYNDYFYTKSKQNQYTNTDIFSSISNIEDTYFNKDIEMYFMKYSNDLYNKLTLPSLYLSNLLGNMYTSSLYGCLISFLIENTYEEIKQMKSNILFFSYGSGLASSMFSLHINQNETSMSTSSSSSLQNKESSSSLTLNNKFTLKNIIHNLNYIKNQLNKRNKISPDIFNEILNNKCKNLHEYPYIPKYNINTLFNNTFYLEKIDEKCRRYYTKYQENSEQQDKQ